MNVIWCVSNADVIQNIREETIVGEQVEFIGRGSLNPRGRRHAIFSDVVDTAKVSLAYVKIVG